mgnify:FL=1
MVIKIVLIGLLSFSITCFAQNKAIPMDLKQSSKTSLTNSVERKDAIQSDQQKPSQNKKSPMVDYCKKNPC